MKSVQGIALMLIGGIIAGGLNVLLASVFASLLDHGAREDEIAVSTYTINVFVGWAMFSGWFLGRIDEEWKKVHDAVLRGDRELFLIEAPKKLAPTIKVLYFLISVITVIAFHLFSIESSWVSWQIQFGVGFLIVTTILVLWDLDDPVAGVLTVPDIPAEWQQALRAPTPTRATAIKNPGE